MDDNLTPLTDYKTPELIVEQLNGAVSKRTLLRLARERRIAGNKVGRCWLISEESVRRFLRASGGA